MAQYCIKPSDVYTSKPEIPEGWRFVAFRPPRGGDSFLGDVSGEVVENGASWGSYYYSPRIIVERVTPAPATPPKTTHLPAFYVSITDVYDTNNPKIPTGWQAVAFRYPKYGEHFLSPVCETRILKADWDWNTVGKGSKALPRIILEPIPTPKETTADDWWE